MAWTSSALLGVVACTAVVLLLGACGTPATRTGEAGQGLAVPEIRIPHQYVCIAYLSVKCDGEERFRSEWVKDWIDGKPTST
ncbi:MAG: hypothetical protein JW889_07330 [Verrucomicrobia bacterium]|nr:hypothetical protein [Verrucomicrobiota bacterium]